VTEVLRSGWHDVVRWTHETSRGITAAAVFTGLWLLASTLIAADGRSSLPTRSLSDAGSTDAWCTAHETGFQMTHPGPVRGLSDEPPRLLAQSDAAPLATAPAAPADKPAARRKPAADAAIACDGTVACDGIDACDGRVTCDDYGPAAAGRRRDDGSQFVCREGLLDNTSIFLAGDGWKNIFDDDDSSNFGFHAGFNAGIDLPGDHAVRGQLGASYGAYDFHGREELLSRDDPVEQRVFVTGGIYKRSDVLADDPLAWGAVYDLLVADEAGERVDDLRLGQIRSYLGYALTERDEVGVWSAFRVMRDYADEQRVSVNVTDQANVFWHRTWSEGGDTWLYAGWADDPGDVVVGLRGQAPLSNRVALMGNFHYIIPSTRGGDVHPNLQVDDCFNQETWNVSFGIVIYRCAKAISPHVSGHQGLPLLPVADNASFNYQAAMYR